MQPPQTQHTRRAQPRRTVFLSHAHADNAQCDRYVAALRQRGFDVWYDRTNLAPASQLSAVIQKELQARTAFVVLLSPASLGSYWVPLETDAYRGLAAQDPSRIIVPVRLEQCTVPPFLNALKWIDAANMPFQNAVDEIAAALGAPATPSKRPSLRWRMWHRFARAKAVFVPLIAVLLVVALLSGLLLTHQINLTGTGGNPPATATTNVLATNTPATTAPSVPQATMTARSATAIVSVGEATGSATATCNANEVLVGGGFSNLGGLNITASFPVDQSSWTVRAKSEAYTANVTLYAYAECLSANFMVGEKQVASSAQTVPADEAPHSFSQDCPAGSIVTGGGFVGDIPTGPVLTKPDFVVLSSQPTTTGWSTTIAAQVAPTVHVYALCATQTVVASHIVQNIMESGQGTIPCTSSNQQVLTDGGFSALNTSIYGAVTFSGDQADQSFANWTVTYQDTSNTYRSTIFAVCVDLPATL